MRVINVFGALVGLFASQYVFASTLSQQPYGTTREGLEVIRYTMKNDKGVSVSFLSFGGVITDIVTPDRNGKRENIVLGFDDLQGYEVVDAREGIHFGALIGRYANRIANGQFTLDGHTYQLEKNDGSNTLHSGNNGYDKRVWHVKPLITEGPVVKAALELNSPDGDQGFPGNLQVTVTYSLSDDNTFRIDYQAKTDKGTVINLTNHSYFNLAGPSSTHGVLDQIVQINADHYLPTDAHSIPTGILQPVNGTVFDFRKPKAIGKDIRANDPQLLYARGFDHNWVLNKGSEPDALQMAVRVVDPESGRTLECLTTQPGLQFYTSNALKGNVAGAGGKVYRQTEAFALETQHYPNSPNQPGFPSTVLKPGEVFNSSTVFRFGTQ
ncbi:aldose 1-epimerase [Pseudomonas duriflava]|uniref:Aldose 1-epimerase n=1 Tax=Pseudomonas duriflava TaxID=459528 RepID=A0A562PY02_9PSED|nr:aldose epimerase family protein [Pseudomonas duriflava]TWI49273.1 aldose 1-epimerase [Pseudomonas duriflava]